MIFQLLNACKDNTSTTIMTTGTLRQEKKQLQVTGGKKLTVTSTSRASPRAWFYSSVWFAFSQVSPRSNRESAQKELSLPLLVISPFIFKFPPFFLYHAREQCGSWYNTVFLVARGKLSANYRHFIPSKTMKEDVWNVDELSYWLIRFPWKAVFCFIFRQFSIPCSITVIHVIF